MGDRFEIIYRCFIVVVLFSVLFNRQANCTQYPVLARDRVGSVAVFEDHSEALTHWAQAGIRGGTLLHIDTHDDIRWIPDEKIAQLRKLYNAKNFSGLREGDSFKETGLYHIGNFIYAAAQLGIVRDVYWIIPFDFFSHIDPEIKLKEFLEYYNFSDEDIKTFSKVLLLYLFCSKNCFRELK